MFHRIISASLSPNTEARDVLQAIQMLCTPWRWHSGRHLAAVERWFERHFNAKVITFNSGRSAFLALLHAFDVGERDEVIVQAFTCVAVPNSVLWAGAIPVYADIDDTYNLDPKDLEQKITPRTKAVIVQHTFGIPAKLDEIQEITKKHNLILIEDCAHALGATYRGKSVGTMGEAAFFSFGRDKALSSVWGGAAIINSNRKTQIEKLKKYHKTLPVPGLFWILQQLLHPIAFSVILPLYRFGIGKLLLVILQNLKLLSLPVYAEEKHGHRPGDFPAKYPNALSFLLVRQLQKLDRFTLTRRAVAKKYDEFFQKKSQAGVLPFVSEASYLRYPVLVSQPDIVSRRAKKRGILLGNWYHNVVDPTGVDFAAIHYTVGSCPKAENAAKQVVNLPTRITLSEAERVIALFRTL